MERCFFTRALTGAKRIISRTFPNIHYIYTLRDSAIPPTPHTPALPLPPPLGTSPAPGPPPPPSPPPVPPEPPPCQIVQDVGQDGDHTAEDPRQEAGQYLPFKTEPISVFKCPVTQLPLPLLLSRLLPYLCRLCSILASLAALHTRHPSSR